MVLAEFRDCIRCSQAVVVDAFNPSTWEAEIPGSLRLAWSTGVPGQPRLHRNPGMAGVGGVARQTLTGKRKQSCLPKWQTTVELLRQSKQGSSKNCL